MKLPHPFTNVDLQDRPLAGHYAVPCVTRHRVESVERAFTLTRATVRVQRGIGRRSIAAWFWTVICGTARAVGGVSSYAYHIPSPPSGAILRHEYNTMRSYASATVPSPFQSPKALTTAIVRASRCESRPEGLSFHPDCSPSQSMDLSVSFDLIVSFSMVCLMQNMSGSDSSTCAELGPSHH
jgi:hypothetical protein